MLLHSDGVAEAHSAEAEMFGFPRLLDVVGLEEGSAETSSTAFSWSSTASPPAGWEQEDDITLVALTRVGGSAAAARASSTSPSRSRASRATSAARASASPRRSRRSASSPRSSSAQDRRLRGRDERDRARQRVERPELLVEIGDPRAKPASCSSGSPTTAARSEIPEAETPDLEAKLEGLQKPRGWGLFLIRNMVDDLRVTTDGSNHTVELVMRLEGGDDGGD